MKTLSILAIITIFIAEHAKLIGITGTSLLTLNVKSQAPSYGSGGSSVDTSYSVFETPIATPRYDVVKIKRTSFHVKTQKLILDSMKTKNTAISNMKFIWMDETTGEIKASKKDSMYKALNNSLSFMSNTVSIPSQFNPSAGTGMSLTGSYPNVTFVNTVPAQTVQAEIDPTVPANVKAISAGDITNWNNKLSAEVDGSTSNEIQTLSISGQTISLSGSASVVIPTQTTALTLSQVTTALGATPLFSEVDGSITNEIQTLSLNGQTVSISAGNYIVIPTQTTVLTSSQVTTALSYVPLSAEVDGSVSNEIQSLSLSGQSVSISGGNTIIIPTQTTAITLASSNTLITITGSHPSFTVGSSLMATYSNTASTTSGVAVFYLTNNKTSSGTALYSDVSYVNPVINDVSTNYLYGWTISVDKKTLTISAKNSSLVTILTISVVAAPTNVTNGTVISVLVKGN